METEANSRSLPKRTSLAWVLLGLGALERLVGWGGSVDFVLARWDEPAWVGTMMAAILSYANVLGLLALLGGFFLFIRNERRRADALYGASSGNFVQPAIEVEELKRIESPVDPIMEYGAKISGLIAKRERTTYNLEILKSEFSNAARGFANWLAKTERFKSGVAFTGPMYFHDLPAMYIGAVDKAKFDIEYPQMPKMEPIVPKFDLIVETMHQSPPQLGVFDPVKNIAFLYAYEKFTTDFKRWVADVTQFISDREKEIAELSEEIRNSSEQTS